MKQLFILCSIIGVGLAASGQEYALEKVLELALKNNHNIKVSQNNVEMAENSSGAGNAGMLPTVNVNAGATYSNQDMKLELLAQPDPIAIERDGAQSTGLNAGVGLNWVVFDGMAMFRNYDKLKLMVDSIEGLKILVTGSSVFDLENKLGEPLVGRKKTFLMYPLAQLEFAEYENRIETKSKLEERLIFGAYPELEQLENIDTKIVKDKVIIDKGN